MISVENLSKRFGDHVLFETVAFQLNPRERLGLVGRNGHGKTTLFRIISGEEEPDEGFINIPNNYRIVHVRQTIDFSRETVLKEAAAGLPSHEGDQIWRAEKILAGLGFSENDMQRHPEEFSGGYQVRLNLAKALVAEPDLVLLDEPTSGLDPISTGKVEAALQELKKEYTIILVPHSVQQAGRTADYAAFFLQGELIEYGKGETLFTAPQDQRTEDYVTGRFG